MDSQPCLSCRWQQEHHEAVEARRGKWESWLQFRQSQQTRHRFDDGTMPEVLD